MYIGNENSEKIKTKFYYYEVSNYKFCRYIRHNDIPEFLSRIACIK